MSAETGPFPGDAGNLEISSPKFKAAARPHGKPWPRLALEAAGR
jgi:hypothetical protein